MSNLRWHLVGSSSAHIKAIVLSVASLISYSIPSRKNALDLILL